MQELWKKNLVPITRVNSLKREETRLRGERGQLISTIAQAEGKISETELQIMQIDQDLRSEVSTEQRARSRPRSRSSSNARSQPTTS